MTTSITDRNGTYTAVATSDSSWNVITDEGDGLALVGHVRYFTETMRFVHVEAGSDAPTLTDALFNVRSSHRRGLAIADYYAKRDQGLTPEEIAADLADRR